MQWSDLTGLLNGLSDEEIADLVHSLPESTLQSLVEESGKGDQSVPGSPLGQARALDAAYRTRPHLDFLSDRLAQAVEDVRNGQNRMLTVSMPPRMGKSVLTSLYLPLWIQRTQPTWKIGMLSHDDNLVNGWSSQGRKLIEEHPALGIRMERDHGATSQWTLTQGGGLIARSIGASVTGLGFKVLLLDDIVKDFVTAHSKRMREMIWDKWRSDIYTRLEPPYLVIAIGTRWHEDDFIGRLLSPEHEGDPASWEKIEFPAIAEGNDVLGRSPGEPLLTPLSDESPEEALSRWADVKESVGTYTWSALYQQSPAPAKGAIFDDEWWRYWTLDPDRADGERVFLMTLEELAQGIWLDSWDTAFKGGKNSTSDFVVGQRWCRLGPRRLLMAQQRGRWPFTETLERMRDWNHRDNPALSPHGQHVHIRLIEEAANGAAVMDVLKDEISGIKPIRPRDSKEGRARSITPEVESGHVLLPNPSEAGHEWVPDLLSELRNFPHDAHDDQVDTLTQALIELRDAGYGSITRPGSAVVRANRARTARTQATRTQATRTAGARSVRR